MRKLIVTGASGILGRRVIELLSDSDFEVYAFYHKNDSSINFVRNINKISCDIFNENQVGAFMKEIAATDLMHLAWTTKHGEYANSVSNFDWLKASINLLKSFGDNGGKKFIGAGTCMEYLWGANNLLLEEKSPNNPNTIYGKCKIHFRDVAKDYCENLGIQFCWGKIFFLFGEGESDKKFISSVIHSALNGDKINCRNPNVLRDYISTNCASKIFVNILKENVEGEFNISCGNIYSLRELVHLILKLLNVSSSLFNAPDNNLDKDQVDLVAADLTKLKENNLLEGINKNFEDEIKIIIKSISDNTNSHL
ncbi:MAG: NAD(P)-dependent oxidoreductase [Rickettsiales bacterium]|nr:NAD(P)-dependent oxidoreductase [Rickettsiales bacterium]